MSQRIRGQEQTIRIQIDGQVQAGSFFKLTEFTSTPRTDLVEESFLGELEDDIDIQHHGWDMSFTVQILDSLVLQFQQQIIEREQNALPHPDITLTVITRFRDPTIDNQVEVYHDVFLKVNETSMSGRKDYVTASFEAKAKRRSLLQA